MQKKLTKFFFEETKKKYKIDNTCCCSLHMTGQQQNPILDFQVNANGTHNLLEATRNYCKDTPLFFTSTNKVYGTLNQIHF